MRYFIMIIAMIFCVACQTSPTVSPPTPTLPSLTTPANLLRIGVDEDWPPFQYLGTDGKPTGVDIELSQEILRRAGFEPKFSTYPWKRVMVSLENGVVDLALGVPKTPDVEMYAYFTDSYYRLGYNILFIKTEDEEKYKNIKSLEELIGTDFRLGTQIGIIYSLQFEELMKNPEFKKQVFQVSEEKQLIEQLIYDRIDGFLSGEYGGAFKIKQLGYEGQITPLFYLYTEEEAKKHAGYIALSKKTMSPQQVQQISNAIQQMQNDGSYQAILEKYKVGNLGIK